MTTALHRAPCGHHCGYPQCNGAPTTGDRPDWSIDGRADLGHAVIDITPAADAGHPCHVEWHAWQLGLPDHGSDRQWLKLLLDRMANVGILAKTGGVYQCPECPRTHQAPCAYQLVVDRHDAHERWAEIVGRHRWWFHTGRPA